MSERSDLAQNFFDIDETIAWYLKSNAIVEQECGYSNGQLLLQVMLRLVFTLPPWLCRFHVYDPYHFGNSVECFDILREVEQIFPDKIFLCTDKEFNGLLENLSAQFALLCQKLFSEQNCRSWREYNQAMRRNSAPRKQLPYKVLICFDLPEQCKQEFYKNATPLEKAFTRLNEQPITFDEMIGFDNFFDTSALNGLQIPLGISLQNNELLKLPVGDFPVHTLIAGMTGSGKSNLLPYRDAGGRQFISLQKFPVAITCSKNFTAKIIATFVKKIPM